MPEITIKNEILCDVDTYWDKCVWNDEYNRRLYLETLKFPGYETVLQRDDGDLRHRKVRIDPPLTGLPGPVKKVLGDRLSYVEEGTYDKKTKRYTFATTPSTLADKTKITGELYCETPVASEKRIIRIAKISVTVKVFMVGSLVEEKILSDLRTSYEAASAFTNAFVREKGL